MTPWTTARQASLSITNSRSLLKLISIELVMPSKHLILCHPLFLLPAIFPSISVFSNESAFHIRWPKLEFQLQHQSFQWTPRTDLLLWRTRGGHYLQGQVVMKAKLLNREFGSPGKGTRSHEPSRWKRVTQTLCASTRMCWTSYNNCYCFICIGLQLWRVSVSLRLAWQLKAPFVKKIKKPT